MKKIFKSENKLDPSKGNQEMAGKNKNQIKKKKKGKRNSKHMVKE